MSGEPWRTPEQLAARAAARARRTARRAAFAGQLGGVYSWMTADEREAMMEEKA